MINKINPYNVFIKWPRLIWRKFWLILILGVLKNVYFGKKGFHVLTDDYGIRFRYYIWCNSSLNKILSRSIYAEEFRIYQQLIGSQDIVFDVGSNVGIHTIFLSRVVKKGRLYSFEPVPQTYQVLLNTIELNRVKNIKTFNVAISDKNGHTMINDFGVERSAWSSIGSSDYEGRPAEQQVLVDTIMLDGFCEQHRISTVNYIKIDVEGHELEVLKGARGLLSEKKIDILQFEISPEQIKHELEKESEIFLFLRLYGYKIYEWQKVKFVEVKGPQQKHQNYYASYKSL